MQPTEILVSEHHVIEQVLECLEKMTDAAAATGKLDRAAATDAVAFFQNFADRCHHRKEEDHLFPLMEARGFPRAGGPTGVMLREHEEGRLHVRGMSAAINGAAGGDGESLQRFVRHVRAYVPLLRAHIAKENERLFPMANQAFDDADQERLVKEFEGVEHEDMRPGAHERYLEIADRLADNFGVPRATGCSRCCGHSKH